MCNGTIMDKLISFSLPLMISSILQLMFNAVDIIVVGRFSGSQALAAVGSTTALINIFTNLFIGISLGANVLAARYHAAKRDREMSEAVHTAIALALVSGILMAFVGVGVSRLALEVMETPADVIDQSVIYMRIYFMGMPFFMLYNYGAAILRAVGDTKRPLVFLIVAGLANVVLDLLLVIVIPLGVAGVAIGTVASQMISCILVLWCLCRTEASYQLHFSRLRIRGIYLKRIFQVGIPAGIQRAASVVGEFLRFHSNGRLHGGEQYSRISVCGSERSHPGLYELHQPELQCKEDKKNGPGFCGLSDSVGGSGSRAWNRSVSVGNAASVHLHIRSGCGSVRS